MKKQLTLMFTLLFGVNALQAATVIIDNRSPYSLTVSWGSMGEQVSLAPRETKTIQSMNALPMAYSGDLAYHASSPTPITNLNFVVAFPFKNFMVPVNLGAYGSAQVIYDGVTARVVK